MRIRSRQIAVLPAAGKADGRGDQDQKEGDLPVDPLRETPVEARSFVAGVLRVRVEKDGYEPVQDLCWNRLFKGDDRGYELRKPGSVPEGMAFVSRTGPLLHVEAAPAGLHMPGVEHLPPRTLGDFFVDRYEVTNRAYKRFVEAGGYERPDFWKEAFVENGRTLTWPEAIARFRDKTQRPGPAPANGSPASTTGTAWRSPGRAATSCPSATSRARVSCAPEAPRR